MATMSDLGLETVIKRAIDEEIRKAVDAAAEKAADEVRQAVRSKIGEISTRIATQYDMRRDGRDLVIRVKIES